MKTEINFVKSNEKRKIIEQLKEQYGIEDLPFLLLKTGKEKCRGYSGHLSKEEIDELGELANIEIVGLYLIKEEHDLLLSFDTPLLLKDQIKKNILEINEKDFHSWIRGNDLDIKVPQGTYIIKFGEDFLGCGKSNGEKIFNYVPKDRRLRK